MVTVRTDYITATVRCTHQASTATAGYCRLGAPPEHDRAGRPDDRATDTRRFSSTHSLIINPTFVPDRGVTS
jgi:hypothetical protein